MDDDRAGSSICRVRRLGRPAARPALWLLLLLVLPVGAQYVPLPPQHSMPGQLDRLAPSPGEAFEPGGSAEEERILRMANAERQKSLVNDANKLLKLARELDSEVGAGQAGALTAAQLRKVAEIEKLAHNVKEKMSTSVRGIPVFGPQTVFPVH